MSITTIGPKDTAENKVVEFPFEDELATAETITSASVGITVTSGTDPSPSSMLVGVPVVVGTSVLQRISGGIAGVTYHLRATADSSVGGVHVVAADLKVVTL